MFIHLSPHWTELLEDRGLSHSHLGIFHPKHRAWYEESPRGLVGLRDLFCVKISSPEQEGGIAPLKQLTSLVLHPCLIQ